LSDVKPLFHRVPSGRSIEYVLGELRRAILTGQLTGGQRLPSEPELAAQFGVARSTLREALKALELSGLLHVKRGYGGGTFVVEVEPEEFTTVPGPRLAVLHLTARHAMDARVAIEPHAARLAAAAPFDKLLQMQASNRDLARQEQSPGRVLHAVVNFHVAVAAAAGNPIFTSVLEALKPFMYRTLNDRAEDEEWLKVCLAEHKDITNQIAARDGEAAARSMLEHVRNEMRVG
jgi:GntR family transcriptional repressor for pyruvate dehydrogenase complex